MNGRRDGATVVYFGFSSVAFEQVNERKIGSGWLGVPNIVWRLLKINPSDGWSQ